MGHPRPRLPPRPPRHQPPRPPHLVPRQRRSGPDRLRPRWHPPARQTLPLVPPPPRPHPPPHDPRPLQPLAHHRNPPHRQSPPPQSPITTPSRRKLRATPRRSAAGTPALHPSGTGKIGGTTGSGGSAIFATATSVPRSLNARS